jgi:hypothetical protein
MAQTDKLAARDLADLLRESSGDEVNRLLEQLAGRSVGELKDPPAQVDKASELTAKWATQTGQVWQIGPHRIVCGDCRDETVVGLLRPKGGPKLLMVWTDPPYGVDYAAKNAYLNRADRGNRVQTPIEND